MKKEFFERILSSIILIPIALFFIVKGSFLFIFFILICFLITSYEWHMMSKKKSYYLFGFVFLIFSFYTIYELIDFAGSYTYFLLITLICVSTDIGGYTFGKIFKGIKLTKISPNKTYSGLIGSFLLSICVAIFIFNNLDFQINILLLAFLISLFSQIGDLFISFLKRKANIKDTGTFLPGHGGLLDRLDGIILAVPIGIILVSL